MTIDKIFVVKLQVPIFSSDPHAQCLVYNEDRSFETFVPMDENIERAMKGRPKAFFRSGLTGKTFYLGTESEVPDPGW
jgi:hypothetical protein